jgi:hypothetical protein
MKIEIITDVQEEPVTLDEIKSALRITGNGHDAELSSLISDAREYLEKAINCSLATKEIKVTTDEALEEDELPYGPVQSLDNSDEDDDEEVYIYEYTAGYDPCPAGLKRGIKLMVKYYFDADDLAAPIPKLIKDIILAHAKNPML